ncbi:acetyltransferase [Psychrobacillus sp. NPDC093180]|uniref:acetyltransferase n=1 Tax=Psychrobacillus sp. NPDC093180 TaxID=3364489 RepID=UPI003823E057
MCSNNIEGLEFKVANGRDISRIIEMLKQLAVWMKDNEINQWRFLLEGGDDEEIEQAINKQETYIVLKYDQLVATFTLLSTQMSGISIVGEKN